MAGFIISSFYRTTWYFKEAAGDRLLCIMTLCCTLGKLWEILRRLIIGQYLSNSILKKFNADMTLHTEKKKNPKTFMNFFTLIAYQLSLH